MEASSKVIVIDGGLSTELDDIGYVFRDSPLWTAKTLIDNTDALKKAHINFIQSGAEIIETASYQLSITNLAKHYSFSAEEAINIIKNSVLIAKQAREESNNPDTLIAGSVGPYGACLNDGSEFSGSYTENLSIQTPGYTIKGLRPRFECLIKYGCDLLAIETIPSIKEATAIVSLLSEYPEAKAWLSFSCKDAECISIGDKFSDAYNKFKDNKQLIAIGINCSQPKYISALLKSVNREKNSTPFVVYTNDGSIWNSTLREYECEKGKDSLEFVYLSIPEWIKLGVKYIGGCCRIGSKKLSEIKKIVSKYNKEHV